jgi:Family of unknown function (DUF6353)
MDFTNLIGTITKQVKANSPEILAALGLVGTVSTAYLTGRASYAAALVIAEEEAKGGTAADKKQRFKERTKLVWKFYIPAAISGALTAGCSIGSLKASGRRTTAAVAVYSLTEKAFTEYKEKVAEEIGKGKEQKITDQLVQDRVTENPAGSREVVILGNGHVLCCELFTGRYFRSDMESMRRAENNINAKIVNERYVTLDDFYELLGLSSTSVSGNVGWDSDRLMELKFSTVISESGEPCLAFDYNYTKPMK